MGGVYGSFLDTSRTIPRNKKLEVSYSSDAVVTSTGTIGQCTMEENTAFVGATLNDGTMRIKYVESASECCGQCACLPDCGAWTWSPRTKICYPKTRGGWYRDARDKIVSGVMISEDVYHREGRLIWEPTLTVGDHTLKSFGQEISTNSKADNKYVVRNPTCDSSEPVVRTMYEKGRWSPGKSGGGVLFFAWPDGKGKSLGDVVRLEYEVYFPENFPWVKGGKLPGIIGGRTGCGGGDDADDCFSVRMMWRRDGDGEIYLYSPKDTWTKDLCDTPGTRCNKNAGMSLMRGAFKYPRNEWVHLAITVGMNDIGKSNGYIRLDVNGETKIEYKQLVYRKSKDVYPTAFTFASWFGGSDDTWSPSTTVEAYFRKFKIFNLDN
ncbi:hypothetical protein M9435_000074 [Picochlorum sp. BPE23]|nr:hypothetical protein M9435_000074 [Picochlorum sp. BPE23]